MKTLKVSRLVLVDGNAILHRAYHALPEWRNRQGEATSGVYGFFSMLIKVRDELKPEYLAVAFDHPSPTFRNVMYVGYQHGRVRDRQMEEDIWGQVERLKECLGRAGAAVYQVEGFEADDVIGTLACQAIGRRAKVKGSAAKSGDRELRGADEAVIVTGDRDLLQLVERKLKVFMPVKGLSEAVLLDRRKVKEKMGVWPEEIVNYKGLVGDASDNYPGVSGVGPKTAEILIEKFGSIEKIYARLDRVRSVAGETVAAKLVEGHDGAVLSRDLARIRTDAPVSFEAREAKMPTDDKLIWLFDEMGYPSLVRRITGKSGSDAEKARSKPKAKAADGQIGLI